MKFKSTVIAASVLAGIMSLSAGAYAMGGASGAHVNYPTTGKIGAVMMNPYGIAPLTAVIRNGGSPSPTSRCASSRRTAVRKSPIR